MARPDLTAQVAERLLWVDKQLRAPVRRWLVVAGGLIVATGLHAVLGDPGIAWISALVVTTAGVAGGGRFGLAVGAAAAFGHALVDAALGVDGREVVGLLARVAALLGLGVVGAVVTRFAHQRNRALYRSATEDSITGLLNARAFYGDLARLRAAGAHYAVVLADIAGMRSLNERHGHPMGTEALRALGHVLQRNTKRGDLVARLGSDEVALALVGADEAGARAAALRLVQRLGEEPLTLPDGQSFQVHAYFGIACYPDHASEEVALLRAAQHAVAQAKGLGPDTIGVANPADAET